MTPRLRKLTAVGLPAREELLVRSLLKMVNGRTTDEWTFQDTLEANLALCRPESALSAMALRRAASHGLLCVSVVHEDEPALPDTLTLRAPIRSTDFIQILNRASESLLQHVRPKPGPSSDAMAAEPVALLLRRQLMTGGASHVAITMGSFAAVVSFRARRIASDSPLPDEQLLRLGLATTSHCEPLDTEQGARSVAALVHHESLDRLLWIVGLTAPDAVLDAGVPVDGTYALRRWPDAGRLPLEPHHLRMASLLVRQPMRAPELAEASGRSLAEARGFLRACAMSCLLELKSPPASVDAVAAPIVAPRRSRYGELFQSLRAVLGIRS